MPTAQQAQARSLEVAGLSCRYLRQRRKTLRIEVDVDGVVWIRCPWYLPELLLRRTIQEKRPWIEAQQQALRRADPLAPDARVTHLGRSYRLQRRTAQGRARIERDADALVLYLPDAESRAGVQALLERWQRRELERLLPPLIRQWEATLGVSVAAWRIRRMRTRWGSCNTAARRISFSLSLIEQPAACIEYVVAHELAHLRERHHNARFYGLLDAHLPSWRERQDVLQQGS